MPHSLVNEDRRKVLILAVTSVAVAPLGGLLLNGRARAGDLPPIAEDDPAAKGLDYVHDASKSTNPKRKPGPKLRPCGLACTSG